MKPWTLCPIVPGQSRRPGNEAVINPIPRATGQASRTHRTCVRTATGHLSETVSGDVRATPQPDTPSLTVGEGVRCPVRTGQVSEGDPIP